jgi:hypothetical protein
MLSEPVSLTVIFSTAAAIVVVSLIAVGILKIAIAKRENDLKD